MSTRLLSQLANRLGLDESEAAPILKALLKQVRERAESGSGVHIPTLGTFKTGDDGVLQFEPDDDLVEHVNEDFSGLDDEPVPSPARAPDTSTALAEASPPPQSDATESDEDASSQEEVEERAEATSSPPVPDDEPVDDDSTEELPAADTGSLWPNVTNAPASQPTASATSETSSSRTANAGEEDKTDPDSDFWSSDREWDLSSVAFGDANEEDEEDPSYSDALSDAPSDGPGDSSATTTSSEDRRTPENADGSAVSTSGAEDAEGSSVRFALGVAFLLAALIGGWIVLGAQGTVPSPGAVVKSLTSGTSTETASTPQPSNAQTERPLIRR